MPTQLAVRDTSRAVYTSVALVGVFGVGEAGLMAVSARDGQYDLVFDFLAANDSVNREQGDVHLLNKLLLLIMIKAFLI